MKDMVVTFGDKKRVDCTFGDHVVHTDQAPAHGGDGSAPEPFELFLASLATCAGIYVLGFCQARNIATDGIKITQTHDFDEAHKLTGVHLRIDLPPDFPEKYVGAVRAAAAGCKVKKVLGAPPEITVEAIQAPSDARVTAPSSSPAGAVM
jgi:putative redox protein